MQEVNNWDKFWLDLALTVSTKSKDRSIKLGCVIVSPDNRRISIGWNGFPRGINDAEDYYHTRPTKYQVTAHAEQNALDNSNCDTTGWTLYLSVPALAPCTNCTRSIIQKGIKRLVMPAGDFAGKGEHWKSDCELAAILLKEAGVEVSYYHT